MDRYVLDFEAQSEQVLNIIEDRLEAGQRQAALKIIKLKLQALFEQGVYSGRLYEKEGVYPYTAFEE